MTPLEEIPHPPLKSSRRGCGCVSCKDYLRAKARRAMARAREAAREAAETAPPALWPELLIDPAQADAHAALIATLAASPIAPPCMDDPAWISDDPEIQRHAARLCGECPCLEPCAAYIAEHREHSGVWAGTMPPIKGRRRRHWSEATGDDLTGRRATTTHAPACARPGWADEPPSAEDDEALIVSRCLGCGAVQLRAPDVEPEPVDVEPRATALG